MHNDFAGRTVQPNDVIIPNKYKSTLCASLSLSLWSFDARDHPPPLLTETIFARIINSSLISATATEGVGGVENGVSCVWPNPKQT